MRRSTGQCHLVNYRLFISSILLSATAIVSGCQSDKATGGLDMQGGNLQQQGAQTAGPAEDVVRESELRAFCPPVSLREGTAYFTTYEKGGQDQPGSVIYQASITDVTRKCTYGTGSFGMTVAVAGRVVPGPKGNTGTITMPIRIARRRSWRRGCLFKAVPASGRDQRHRRRNPVHLQRSECDDYGDARSQHSVDGRV